MRPFFARGKIRCQTDAKATAMDCFTYPIQIAKTNDSKFERIEALVDTRELYSILPASTLKRLGIAPTDTREFQLADGSIIDMDIAEVRIRVDGRQAGTIVVFGEEDEAPRMGSYSLEGLRLCADAANKRLIDTPYLRA